MVVTVGGYAHPAHRPFWEGKTFASCLLLKTQLLTGPVGGTPAMAADDVARDMAEGEGVYQAAWTMTLLLA